MQLAHRTFLAMEEIGDFLASKRIWQTMIRKNSEIGRQTSKNLISPPIDLNVNTIVLAVFYR
jgi:hypothetical protein